MATLTNKIRPTIKGNNNWSCSDNSSSNKSSNASGDAVQYTMVMVSALIYVYICIYMYIYVYIYTRHRLTMLRYFISQRFHGLIYAYNLIILKIKTLNLISSYFHEAQTYVYLMIRLEFTRRSVSIRITYEPCQT